MPISGSKTGFGRKQADFVGCETVLNPNRDGSVYFFPDVFVGQYPRKSLAQDWTPIGDSQFPENYSRYLAGGFHENLRYKKRDLRFSFQQS